MDEESITKVWHRPWTTEEMRQQSANWNLAGDAGLLQHLQQFSQNLLARTHACEKGLDSMLEQLSATTLEVHNVTNQFLSLANIQFVENRVYEDDETPTEEKKEEQTVSKEEQEAEALARVHEALVLGMSVLDSMFDTLEVPESDSDEEESIGERMVLKPRDPYASRPLPYLIGSKEFMDDDRIGLGSLSEVEEMLSEKNQMQSTDSGSESDTAQHAVATKRARLSISNSSNSDTENEDAVGPLLGKQQKMSETEGHSDSENIFGKDPEEKFDDADNVSTFASRLAAKLGTVAALESNEQPTMNANKVCVQPSMVWEADNAEDDDDDSLFSNKSSKLYGVAIGKGGGGGLFDDLEDADNGALWGNKPNVPSTNTGSKKSDHIEGSLFVTDDTNEDLFATEDSVKIDEPSQNSLVQKPKNMTTSTPNLNDAVQNDRKKLCSQDISKIGSPLFDTVGGDEDLFHSPRSEVPGASSDSGNQTNSTKSAEKKLPAGAVSVFGGIDVFKSNVARPLSSPSNGSEGSLSFGEKGFLNTSGNTTSGIKTLSSSQDEYSKRAEGKSASATGSRKLVSLFNDSDSGEEEVLFSSASSNSSRSHKSQGSGDILAVPSEKPRQKGIFEADDELFGRKTDGPDFDIFNIKSEISAPPTKNLEYDDDDDDLFKNHSVNPKAQSIGFETSKTNATNNAFTVTKSDDLFDIFANIDNPKAFQSDNSIHDKDVSPAKQTQLAGEYTDDNPSVFGEVKSIFDNLGALEDDNLFGSISNIAQKRTESENNKTDSLFSTDIFEDVVSSEFKIGSSDVQPLSNDKLPSSEGIDIFKESIEAVNSVTHNSSKYQASKDLSAKALQTENSIPPSTSSNEQIQDSENVSVGIKKESNSLNSESSILDSTSMRIDKVSTESKSFETKSHGSTGVSKPEPPKTLNIRKTTEPLFNSSSVINGQTSDSPECNSVSSAESKDSKPPSLSSVSEIVPPHGLLSLLENEKARQIKPVPAKRSLKQERVSTRDKSSPDESIGEVKPIQSPNINVAALSPNQSSSPQYDSEGAVGFDHPAQLSNTLHSAGKNRARIQVKRRPQSRRARHEAIRASDPVPEECSGISTPGASSAENQMPSRNYLPNFATVTDNEDQDSSLDFGKEVTLGYKENPSSSLSSLAEPGGPGVPYAGSNPLSPSTDEEDLFGVPSDLPSEYDSNSQKLFTSAPVLSPLDHSSSITNDTDEDTGKLSTPVLQNKAEPEIPSTTNDDPNFPPFKMCRSALSNAEKQTVKEGATKKIDDSQVFSNNNSDSDDLFSELKKPSPLLETVEEDFLGSLKGRDSLFTKNDFEVNKDASDKLFGDASGYGSISPMTRYLIEENNEDLIDDSLFTSKGPPSIHPHYSFSSRNSKENLDTEKSTFDPPDDAEENATDLFASCDDSLSSPTVGVVKPKEELSKTVKTPFRDETEENLFSAGILSNSSTEPGVNSTNNNNKSIKKSPLLKADVEDIFANDDCEHEDLFKAPAMQSTVSKKGLSVKGTSSLFDDEDDDDIFRSAKRNIKTTGRGASSKNESDTLSTSQASSRAGATNHTTLAKAEVKLFEDPLMALNQ